MGKISNNHDFGLAMAVWLAHDEYDNGSTDHPGKNVISATSLLKPTRQIVLSARLTPSQKTPDVADVIASSLGTAIHDSIEHAWITGYKKALARLGYPDKAIAKIKINPDPATVMEDDIPIYLEQRKFRSIFIDNHEIIISGKFDQIIDGEINDTKTTSVYTFLKGSSNDKFAKQGSIYRWLDPKIVTSDIMRIQHFFTDWKRADSKINPDYPKHKIAEKKLQLLGLSEIERFIETKLREIIRNQDLPEEDLVRCTNEELWISDPVWKYYSDPAKAAAGGRATKNFDSAAAAYSYRSSKSKGVVVPIAGQVKACGYCPAFEICTQKDEYEHG